MTTKRSLFILIVILWIPFIIVFSADIYTSGDRIWSEEPSRDWPFHTEIYPDDMLRTKLNVYSSLCYSWTLPILIFQILRHKSQLSQGDSLFHSMDPSILCWLWMGCIISTSLSIYSSLFHAAATFDFAAGDLSFMFMLCGSWIPLLVFAVTPRIHYRIAFTLCYNLWIPIWMVLKGWPGDDIGFAVAGSLMLCSVIAVVVYYKTRAMSMKAPVISFIFVLLAGVCKYMDQPLGIYCEGTALFHFGTAIAVLIILVDMTNTSLSKGTDSDESKVLVDMTSTEHCLSSKEYKSE